MLVLTRKTKEAIMVDDDIKVIILGVKGNQIKVGIEAPKNVGVHREEIWLRIQEEKKNKQIKEDSDCE